MFQIMEVAANFATQTPISPAYILGLVAPHLMFVAFVLIIWFVRNIDVLGQHSCVVATMQNSLQDFTRAHLLLQY